MSPETIERRREPRMEAAIADIEKLIRARYPAATFEVAEGDDPAGTYLWATVDVADTDEVMDLVINRLLDLQVGQRLPLYFVPTPPFERVAQELQRQCNRPSRAGGHAALSHGLESST